MLHLLNWLKSKLTINHTLHYHGTTESLHAQLQALTKNKWGAGFFYSIFISENYYKVDATISLGTVSTGGFGNAGIRLHLKIQPLSDSLQQITLRTKVRPENWFLVIMFIFFFIASIAKGDGLLNYAFVAGVGFICFVWFNFIYKVQERILLDKVVKALRLKD